MAMYFHSAPLSLERGSIIKPGNWGRVINCYRMPNPGDPWLLARELAFETVRATEFSELPSRLSSAFVFENSDDAVNYRNQFTKNNIIYEVELVNVTAKIHRAAFNLVTFPNQNVEFLPVIVSLARKYWRGEDIQVPELVTTSSLCVRGVLMGSPGCYQP